MAKKKQELTSEELLAEALVREEDWPYEVPGNWVWVRLGSIISVSSGKSLTSSKMNSSGKIPVYGGNGITGYHDISNIEADNIVLGRVGYYCGSVHYIFEPSWITDNALVVSFERKWFNIKFMFWLLNILNLRKNDSSTAQPVISGSKIYSLEVPLPPLAEQQRIVDRIESLFDKLDQAKDLIQDALDSFETRKAAILHQAFTGQLSKKWREAHGFGMESWEEYQFQDIILDTKIGIVRNLSEQSENFEFKYLKMNNIDRYGHIDFNNITKVNATKDEIEMYSLKDGDFLFNTRNSRELVGKNAIWKEISDEVILFNNNIMRVRFITNVISIYVAYYFNSIKGKSDLDKIKKVTTNVAAIYAKDLKKILIPIPSIQEQQEIVRILDDLFAKEQNAKDLIDLIDQIEAIKKTILGQAFRGQLGTNEAGEESAIEILKKILQ